MFKKKFKISSNNILSGKDKKKIVKDLSKICTGECVEHFFEKNEKIFQNKLQGSKIVIYSIEEYPAFIDATSKGDYFPTLYTIHQYPNLVQAIEIHPEVENFIHKGANLMWPGVKDPESLGEFEKDEVVYIMDSKKNMIAVGAMGCSYEEYQKQVDKKAGIAVFILHQINDTLWESGPKKVLDPIQKVNQESSSAPQQQQQAEPQKQPEKQQQEEEVKQDNKKKTQEKKPVAENIKKKEESEDEDDEIEEEDLEQFLKLQKKGKQQESDGDDEGVAPQQQAQPKGKSQKEVKKTETKFSDDEDEKGGKKGKKKGKKSAKKETKEKPQKEKQQQQKQQQHKEEDDQSDEEEEEHHEGGDADEKDEEEVESKEQVEQKSDVPQEIMDQYIYDAFMNALKMSLQDKELPMDSSAFYQNHILQCKKENFNIDLRVSSYKKIGKFFQVMSKPPHNLIEYKEAKKGTAPQITKVNRKNQKLVEWAPTIFKVQSQKKDIEEKKVDQDAQQRVEISELYKIKKGMEPIFGELTKEEYLTKNEVRDKINNYITKECKIDKKFVVLDPFLANKFGTVEKEQPQQQEQQQPQQQQQQQQGQNPEAQSKEEKKPQVANEEDFEDVEGEAGDDEEEKQQQKQKVKRGQDQRQKLTREDLQKKIDQQLIAYHQIKNLDTQETKIKQGEFPGIQLIAEKAHNKNITKIIGLENFGMNPNNFTNKFQIKFASSVNVHDLPGKDAGKELVIQGNFLQDLMDFFTEESKIDKRFIHQQDKLHKKKK